MKKYILIATALFFAAAACTKVTPDVETVEQDVELTFNAQNYVPSTKAAYPDTLTFGCYALYTGSYSWNEAVLSDAVKFMNDAEISYQTNTWKAKGQTYYWPKTGKLSFACYSPKSANLKLGSDKASLLSVTDYKVEADKASQDDYDDLMIADFVQDLTRQTAAVNVIFRHKLAKVGFTSKEAREEYSGVTYHIVVNNISVNNISNEGDFNYNVTDSSSTWTNVEGNVSSDMFTTATISTNTVGQTYTTTPGELSTTAAATGSDYFVMPQTLDDDSTISVTYTIYACNSDGKILSAETATSGKDIKNLSAEWDINKSYTYAITIDPVDAENEITFAPVIADWEDGNGSINL